MDLSLFSEFFQIQSFVFFNMKGQALKELDEFISFFSPFSDGAASQSVLPFSANLAVSFLLKPSLCSGTNQEWQ